MSSKFAHDLQAGLSGTPKSIPSKYFYDDAGNALFERIMELPDYYLTRCEYEILSMNREELLTLFTTPERSVNLIEFGAGDGLKTKLLLHMLADTKMPFVYIPVDISQSVLDRLVSQLRPLFPGMALEPYCGDYADSMAPISRRSDARNIVLFLGSTIGNLTGAESVAFLKNLRGGMGADDLAVIGFDLKKDPSLILNAYHDPFGVTREFNLNLLRRINREFAADFDLTAFEHFPLYDPISGEARSYLISTKRQTVTLRELGTAVSFHAWEPIHTEVSKKYDGAEIETLAETSGFKVEVHLHDCKHNFVDSVWRAG